MNKLQELQDKIDDWADERGASMVGTLKHLQEEVEHLKGNPYDPLAIADVYILLLRVASRAGFSTEDMYLAAEAKHTINLSREWLEPDSDGVVRHKK
jgi:hypothetical protein